MIPIPPSASAFSPAARCAALASTRGSCPIALGMSAKRLHRCWHRPAFARLSSSSSSRYSRLGLLESYYPSPYPYPSPSPYPPPPPSAIAASLPYRVGHFSSASPAPPLPLGSISGYSDHPLRSPSTTELSWKCTSISTSGHVQESVSTFSKLAFCKQHHLQPRDLRKLDARYTDQYPAILPRASSVLVVNLHHVRALITPESVMLFNHGNGNGNGTTAATNPMTPAAARAHADLVGLLRHRLSVWWAATHAATSQAAEFDNDGPIASSALPSSCSSSPDSTLSTTATTTTTTSEIGAELPFEFVVLETILQNVLATLDDELRELARPVDALVHALVRDGGGAGGDPARQRDLLADMYVYVQRLSTFQTTISNIRDVLREVLENEEDLEEMHLTSLTSSTSPAPLDNHDDLELLIETYLSYTEELLDSTLAMLQTVQSTERFITLTLDSQRNALLILEIKFAMFGVACTSGALLASLFGMNLMSGLEESPVAFAAVCTLTGAISGGVLGSGIWRMKAVTRRTQLPDALLPAVGSASHQMAMHQRPLHVDSQFGGGARPLVEVAAVGAPTPRVGTMPGSGQAHAQGQGHGQQQQDLHQRLITGLFKSFERPRFEFGHSLRPPVGASGRG